jgi:hypothetical protein
MVREAAVGYLRVSTDDQAREASTPPHRRADSYAGTWVPSPELERDLISERTKAGLQAARRSGKRLGRPPVLPKELRIRIRRLRTLGWSLQRIADHLTDEGVSTAQGGRRWYRSTVKAALEGGGSVTPSTKMEKATSLEVSSTFRDTPAYHYIRKSDKLPTYEELGDKRFDKIVAKVYLFNPTGAGTWWIAAYDPDTTIAWGAAEIFVREVCSFSMRELVDFRGRFGLPIERDLYYKPVTIAEILKDQT